MEELFALAKEEGIITGFFWLPESVLGVYYNVRSKPPIIILNISIQQNRMLVKCILAEELGHHFTTGFNIMACALTHKSAATKYENIAQWWATQYLVPLTRLEVAVSSGVTTTYELAEYFDVTERFMGTSLRLYREKGRP